MTHFPNIRPNTISSAIRILIANQEGGYCQQIRKALASQSGFRILAETSDAGAAIGLITRLQPDIVVLDLALLEDSDLDALRRRPGDHSAARTIVLVNAIETEEVLRAFRLGAHGVVPKTTSSTLLVKSIRTVMAGQYWLGNDTVAILVRALRDLLAQTSGDPANDYGLTHRESAITGEIGRGRTNKEVATQFFISERTVKHHLTSIFSKVGVSNRLELALFALKHGLIEQLSTQHDSNRAASVRKRQNGSLVSARAMEHTVDDRLSGPPTASRATRGKTC